jgi:hypothetical protein
MSGVATLPKQIDSVTPASLWMGLTLQFIKVKRPIHLVSTHGLFDL